jgi:hypothetical protein
MVNDPNPVLRAEMRAAVDSLTPQVNGLEAFAKISPSPDALTAIAAELIVRERRLQLHNEVLGALDLVVSSLKALHADDSYPGFAPNKGTQAVFAEIQQEEADLTLAADLFRAGASSIELDVSNVVHRPQKIPAS